MQKVNFNQQWALCRGAKSIMESMMGGGSTDEPVALPHDAMLAMARSADAPSGPHMAYFQGENITYSKSFFVPAEEKEQVHYLYFDGVFMDATIQINGCYAEKYTYGYAPCAVRIDEFLRYGEENQVTVAIRGSALPNSRWYPGEGICRDVWYLTGSRLHIECDGLQATTLECGPDLAVLEIKTEVSNAGLHPHDVHVELEILDNTGAVVARRRARVYAKAGSLTPVRQRVELDSPRLWNVDTPELYTCVCRIVEDGQAVDCAETTFGIRKLRLDSRHGLRINGESVKLKGGCVHHDNGVLGAVSLLDAELRRVRLLKEGGYNAIRTSHNPPSTALLDACDRLGMLVMHEFTDVWTESKTTFDYAVTFPQTWERDLEAVVRRDYNHPSVVLWSIGNEIPETGSSISTQWGRKLVEKFKSLDSTRFVTNGINVMVSCASHMAELLSAASGIEGADGVNDIMGDPQNVMARFDSDPFVDPFVEESCDMLDVVGYNYTAGRYEREHLLHPEWVFVGSETFSADLDRNWDIVSRNPYAIGDFSWTAWDYLGEAGCGRIERVDTGSAGFCGGYPWLTASDGDFDLTGYRRPMSYWRETVWGGRHQPYIAVHRLPNFGKELYISRWNFTDAVRCWTWPGYEGKETAIEVYSDAEEVELLVNGKSLGRKPVGDSFKKFYCRWDTVYEPGEVVAVAYTGGQETGRDVLRTAGESGLVVSADKTVLRAGSEDLCYLEIERRDAQGVLDVAAETEAVVSVSGPVTLAGCGSGNPCTEERYYDAAHPLYEGRLLAVLKAGAEPGKAVVTVSSPGLETVTVELEIV